VLAGRLSIEDANRRRPRCRHQ